jgi:hypothetical protein
MKVASFNVENMFRRPVDFKAKDKVQGDRIGRAYAAETSRYREQQRHPGRVG